MDKVNAQLTNCVISAKHHGDSGWQHALYHVPSFSGLTMKPYARQNIRTAWRTMQ